MVPQLVLLLMTGAAAGSGFIKDRANRLEPSVALDAAGHASNLAQQLEGSGTEQAKVLIRSMAEPTEMQDEPTSIQNMHEKQDQPCTPAMLIEYHEKQKVKQDPTTSESTASSASESTDTKGAAAAAAESKLASKGSGDEDTACAQLAAKITPALAYGHVIITEPDGNISQVPGEVKDDSVEAVAKEAVSSTVDTIVFVLWMSFWVLAFCILLFILGSRWSQEQQVKKLKRNKERGVVEGVTGNGAAPKAEAARGSSSAAAAAPATSVPAAAMLKFVISWSSART